MTSYLPNGHIFRTRKMFNIREMRRSTRLHVRESFQRGMHTCTCSYMTCEPLLCHGDVVRNQHTIDETYWEHDVGLHNMYNL